MTFSEVCWTGSGPDFGEDAAYLGATAAGYAAEHEAIFDPPENLRRLILAISSAISH